VGKVLLSESRREIADFTIEVEVAQILRQETHEAAIDAAALGTTVEEDFTGLDHDWEVLEPLEGWTQVEAPPPVPPAVTFTEAEHTAAIWWRGEEIQTTWVLGQQFYATLLELYTVILPLRATCRHWHISLWRFGHVFTRDGIRNCNRWFGRRGETYLQALPPYQQLQAPDTLRTRLLRFAISCLRNTYQLRRGADTT